ncbi:peptide deformylase [Arachidicoccus ginsenosidivorans]|jgi:peptide deformylase|uniref:Peptide deformylase n=1 Tax=Arachidicoccus ginsenosidivorans TaxID=496057 RepID=A0A5B8VRE6_9BACT|nr:peptide deformylase [Arachidicoccus ginsenosidivorans]QEC73472.1 peptide deformylase [Arachidicoccus ginsenosidivorans]
MQLPIIAYGSPILRKVARNIDQDYPDLKKLIEDMWETLYASNGVGLAAPQINRDIRLFVVDSEVIFNNLEPEDETYPDAPGLKRVFINAKIKKLEGEPWPYNEGCLSIPKINEDVTRPASVTLEYLDEDFQPHTETFIGITARIIQHEYDHIEGKLFIDYLKPLKKKMLQRKLTDISKGKIQVGYKMLFPK